LSIESDVAPVTLQESVDAPPADTEVGDAENEAMTGAVVGAGGSFEELPPQADARRAAAASIARRGIECWFMEWLLWPAGPAGAPWMGFEPENGCTVGAPSEPGKRRRSPAFAHP
jgi:hypothetical protein